MAEVSPEKMELDQHDASYQSPSSDNEKSGATTTSPNASTQLHDMNDANGSDTINEKAPLDAKPEIKRKITGVKWVIVVTAILSSTFLFALDNTVVADVQEDIVKELGQIQKLPWLSIGFLVAAVSTNLIW